MLVKSQVKYIQTLGHKKFRDAEGVFVAEGKKIVEELMQSEIVQMVQCYATPEWLETNAGFLKNRSSSIVTITEKELERISFLNSPNQVLAVFTKPVFKQNFKTEGITILLETIQDPGNLGTILRTADWFGVKRIVCSLDTADLYNPKVIQSAMGSLIRVEVIYSDLVEYIRDRPGEPVLAGVLDGVDLQEKIKLPNVMVLMGNESKGISSTLENLATRKIRIPRKGGAESLNVAVAAGIILSQIDSI